MRKSSFKLVPAFSARLARLFFLFCIDYLPKILFLRRNKTSLFKLTSRLICAKFSVQKKYVMDLPLHVSFSLASITPKFINFFSEFECAFNIFSESVKLGIPS